MGKIFVKAISFYQIVFPFRGHCRFYPTCSQYAKIVINEHGVIKGIWLTLLRLLGCQPIEISKRKFLTFNF